VRAKHHARQEPFIEEFDPKYDKFFDELFVGVLERRVAEHSDVVRNGFESLGPRRTVRIAAHCRGDFLLLWLRNARL
jgi:hypothetical protein